MFRTLKARFSQFCQEMWLQIKIRFRDGRDELALYRVERDLGSAVLWVPSKGNWVRARLLCHGQRYDRIEFVDGAGKKGKRSPLSYRLRDPRKRGADKPRVDARYSGNRPATLLELIRNNFREGLLQGGATMDEMAAALRTLEGG